MYLSGRQPDLVAEHDRLEVMLRVTRVLLFFHIVSHEPAIWTLIMVLVAQKSVFTRRPFLVYDEEGVVTKDYASGRVTRLDKRSSGSLYKEFIVSGLPWADLGALAPQLLLKQLGGKDFSYLAYAVSVGALGQRLLGSAFEVMFRIEQGQPNICVLDLTNPLLVALPSSTEFV